MSRWFRDMGRTTKAEQSENPRIDTLIPGAALPGGEDELAADRPMSETDIAVVERAVEAALKRNPTSDPSAHFLTIS